MYIMQEISNRIKQQAKIRSTPLGDMLTEIGLSVNTISHLSKGTEISFVNLAKIADYLDCSVDYLLCRTENPDSHKTHTSDITFDPCDEQLATVVENYRRLSTVDKARLLVMSDEMLKK